MGQEQISCCKYENKKEDEITNEKEEKNTNFLSIEKEELNDKKIELNIEVNANSNKNENEDFSKLKSNIQNKIDEENEEK